MTLQIIAFFHPYDEFIKDALHRFTPVNYVLANGVFGPNRPGRDAQPNPFPDLGDDRRHGVLVESGVMDHGR